MKKETHPTYYSDAKVVCACGNSFTTGSTIKDLRVEICSNCHPFYTGKEKVMDTAGRVDRFKKRQAKRETLTKKKITKTHS
ncbi:MAG: 50S ribosomal protein L31 [Parcubacteria group bacterium GW2011_GWA2_46_39]|nr:MAG: 50S ribosomal protein L31 [Parcubacteria group bacterium GW2011_GWA2_46_39]